MHGLCIAIGVPLMVFAAIYDYEHAFRWATVLTVCGLLL
jgi:hypothetical protein